MDDLITNLANEIEPGDIKRTPRSLIVTSYNCNELIVIIIVSWSF